MRNVGIRRNVIKLAVSIFLLAFGGHALAQHLVWDAKVTMVTSAYDEPNVFYIKTENGTGPCSDPTTFIEFRGPLNPNSDRAAAESHRRAYAMALLAFTTGQNVLVYDYDGGGCADADKLNIYASGTPL